MTGRGGHRIGSGRKPDFDVLERLAIGGEFERRLVAERERIDWERHEARPGMVELREAQALYRAEGKEVGWSELVHSHRGRDLAEDIAGSIHTMRRTPPDIDEPNRLFDIPQIRTKGLVAQIAKEVAGHFAPRLRRTVSTRMAMRCLAEYRSFFREPRADL